MRDDSDWSGRLTEVESTDVCHRLLGGGDTSLINEIEKYLVFSI
jgi:hypothetical protein